MGAVGLRDVFVVAPAASFNSQPQHHHQELFASQDHPIIPLLSTAPCLVDDPHDSRGRSAGIHLWQQQQQNHYHHHHQHQNQHPNPNPNNQYLKKPVPMLETAGILATASSSGGGPTCQDCGNQAKKDCSHRRCRTCCKSRGFDCSTHVKSTWVPAACRRERQLSTGALASSASTSAPKRPRLLSSQTTTSHTSTSNTTRSFDTSSSHQDAAFRDELPGQVKAPALFKCVRVTSVEDDGEDEYAYQAMVKIGGHVFKGFLYDQGADHGSGEPLSVAGVDNSGNNNNPILNISELHLGGGASASGGRRHGPPSSSMVPAADASVLLGGTNYGNPIN